MQVAKAASSAVEDREELTAGKQLLADMMMVQQVKDVFAWDPMEGLSEPVEACLAV